MRKKTNLSDEDAALFKSAVADTRPLPTETRQTQKHKNARPPEKRIPVRRQIKSEPVKESNFSTGISVDRTDDDSADILFGRSGLTKKQLKRLKQGEYRVQATLDMHGMRTREAERALERFLAESFSLELSCILVIYGKGYHSIDNKSVIRPAAVSLMKKNVNVLGFCSATPRDGGSGAAYVLLRNLS